MKITEVIEFGKVLDIYPFDGCIVLRVKGLRTGIEYQGCKHQVVGRMPAIYDTVAIERADLEKDEYAFRFSREGVTCDIVAPPAVSQLAFVR